MKEKFLILVMPVMAMLLILPSISMGARDVDPCRLFPNGTKLRDPDDCSQAITCVDFKPVYGTTKCTGSKPFYDKDKDSCVAALTDHSLCDIDCSQAKEQFVKDPKSCFGYFYCLDEELALYGHCPDLTHFNETSQACIFSHESDCSISTLDFCAIVKDGINFNDESSCTSYYVCKKGVLTNTDCSNSYYDAAKGSCVQKSLVNCAAHPFYKNVCGDTKSPKKNMFVSDDATCRGSFYCADIESGPDPNPIWVQCPENTFFNATNQMCQNPLEVACSEDRCEGRNLTFVSSSTKGCRHYLTCSNGVKVQELTCGNKFFDEEQGICTSSIITYNSCIS